MPVVVLLAALAVTAIATYLTHRAAAANDALRFDNVADSIRHEVDSRLDAYIAMLRGGAGLFAASDEVRPAEFRAYVERLQLAVRYPGIQGIGFSRLVREEEREHVAAMVRDAGLPFRYWPDLPGTEVHAIVFLEPQDERNRVALGYNMYSEAVRQEAMSRARDTGEPAASGRVKLVQELVDPAHPQSGFLIYLPVYRGAAVPQTIEERRNRLFGFVYSPFRADDLLRRIVPSTAAAQAALEVYDGRPAEEHLLHRSGAVPATGGFEVRRVTDVAGRSWTMVMRPGPAFRGTAGAMALVVAVAGLVMATLLFVATRSQVRARESAERTAEELRRSEEVLRSANLAKDEFLAVISHELRTPLNAIMGWAAMMRKGQLASDAYAYALDVIQRNAANQAMLVEDLLDISRAVAGRLRLDVTTVPVADVLKSALDAVRPQADAQGVRLIWDGVPDLGTIKGDARRLQQIVANLLSNGIKFTPRGGTVTLGAERTGDMLTIHVGDTGIGIDQEFLPQVFERFRQADTSTTRAHTGVGLGLAIARHLVELHNGTIAVHSDGPDRGSTFTVRLPAG